MIGSVMLPSLNVSLIWLSWFDLMIVAVLAVIGFFMVGYNLQRVLVLLGRLIGPLVERHFRQGLTAANEKHPWV